MFYKPGNFMSTTLTFSKLAYYIYLRIKIFHCHIIFTCCKFLMMVKVKFALEQATKAQRGSSGIVLLFP
jgi:hypothetical protein